MRSSTQALLGLHLLLAVYSVGNIFSKLAADAAFMSLEFVLYYGGVLLTLAVYALGWQQAIKRMPLTTAYANKAATIVWGIVFGVLFFDETVTPPMLVGAAVIVAGIALYAVEEGRVQAQAVRDMNASLGGPVRVEAAAPEGAVPEGAASAGGGGAREGAGEAPSCGTADGASSGTAGADGGGRA